MSEDANSEVVVVESGFLNYLKKLPEKSHTTIRFFNRTDFYTVHGEDALFVAKEVFKSTNNIKVYGSEKSKLESLILNKNQFETLVKDLLLIRHYRVEVYSSRGGHRSNEWFLEYKGSPGNLEQFENIVFGTEISTGATAMAIKIGGDSRNRTVGAATVEMSARLMTVSQFQDDDNFTELEGLIVQIGPKEIIIPENADKTIVQLGSRCGALISTRKVGDFAVDNLASDLNRLLQWKEGQTPNSSALPEMKHATAACALNALLKYLELSGNDANFGQFSLSATEPNRFVHVDASSAKALGLIPTRSNGAQYSLVGFLDRCRTPQGRRLLAQWVKQPLKDARAINERLDVVSAFLDDPELRVALSEEHLRRFPDLQLLARKLQKKNCSLQDCYKIYQAVERIKPLLEALKAAEYSAAVRETFVDSLAELADDMSKFCEMISSTLDTDSISKGEFLVKVEFSEDLIELREKLNILEAKMEAECCASAKDLDLEVGKTIKLEATGQIGYHFRTTNKKEEKKIRNNYQYKLIDATKSGLRFQSKKLAEFSEDYLETKRNYDECQRSIVEEIVKISAGYVGPILSINGVVAKLDVLTSFAVSAANAPVPYARPVIRGAEEGILRLREARHPMMEVQESVSFIPNDVDMRSEATTLYIITGPNMGGKSTYIRTIGVVALLAHVGSFVPCREAEISLRDAILARIGAGDSQSTGVSTFMNEMVETSAILRRATNDSLVMIDELGRGTSTYEGCGIAWAIAKYLSTEKKPFTLFATHFQELTALPEEVPSAANFHVTAATTTAADDDGLTLLYQVAPGASDRSFGLDVARMARFRDHVIERAKQKQMELERGQGLGVTGASVSADDIRKGETLVTDFLTGIKEGGAEMLDSLRERILKENNPYIAAMLS